MVLGGVISVVMGPSGADVAEVPGPQRTGARYLTVGGFQVERESGGDERPPLTRTLRPCFTSWTSIAQRHQLALSVPHPGVLSEFERTQPELCTMHQMRLAGLRDGAAPDRP